MNTTPTVQRDERTVAVENASYRWSATFVSFALLIDMVCRGVFFHETAWDLFALACVPGIICLIYQARKRTLVMPHLSAKMILLFCLALCLGLITSIVMTIMIASRG